MGAETVLKATAAMTDQELISCYRQGDGEACALLLARYTGFLRRAVSRIHLQGMETSDLMQEAYMGLLAAVRTYRIDRNASFYTYASHCVRNRLKNLFSVAKKTVPVPDEPYDEETQFAFFVPDPVTPEERFIEKESYQRLLHLMDVELSQLEKDVFLLYLSGYDYVTIANRLEFPRKAIDNALQRARRKLKLVAHDL